MPSVDVMIPCYNYGRYLRQCVESVLAQNVESLRIVIIDNASTDDSLQVARQLAGEDPRIHIVAHPENVGQHASFNEGVDLASADYFVVLCADDVFASGALGRAVEILEMTPQATIALGTECKVEAAALSPDHFPPFAGWSVLEGDAFIEQCCLCLGIGIDLGAVLVRTWAQKEVGHFNDKLQYSDDLEMVLRLARMGKVVSVDGPLCIRREHASQISKTQFANECRQLKEHEAAFLSFFGSHPAAPRNIKLQRIVQRELATRAFRAAISHARRGRLALSVDLVRYGMRLNPAMAIPVFLGKLRRALSGPATVATAAGQGGSAPRAG